LERSSQNMTYRSVIGWGNRGWLEIINLIISASEHGALKTHIMYRCNLNSKQVQQYLDYVLARDLVVASPDPEDVRRTIYTTTERGRKFMRAYNELAAMFNLQNPSLDI
jgi:predicted transcriptional regulator